MSTNKKSTKSGHKTHAFTKADGDKLTFGVKSLHVMLLPDGDGWFAQGLEIDYAACGSTMEEAKKHFAHGLVLTFSEHLTMYGDIAKALVVAPQEAWEEYYKTPTDQIEKDSLSFVATVELFEEAGITEPEKTAEVFPFAGIQYIQGLQPSYA